MADHADIAAIHFTDNLTGQFRGRMDIDLSIDTENPVYHLRDKAEIMRHGEHRHPVCQVFEDLEELEVSGWIDVGGRFVEKQNLRFTGQGPGYENTLPLSTGEAVEGVTSQAGNAQLFHGLHGDSAIFRIVASQSARSRPTHEHHIHDRYRKRGVMLQVLRHIADFLSCLFRGKAQDLNGAALRGEQSQNQLEQGRLTAAIRANQCDCVQFVNSKGDIGENGEISIGKRDLLAQDGRNCRGENRFCCFQWLTVVKVPAAGNESVRFSTLSEYSLSLSFAIIDPVVEALFSQIHLCADMRRAGFLQGNFLTCLLHVLYTLYKGDRVPLALVNQTTKGATSMEEKETETFVQKIEQQRDEILLKIHLAKAEVKDEWAVAEKKWEHLKSKTPVVARESGESMKDVGAAVKLVGEELLRSYERIKKVLER